MPWSEATATNENGRGIVAAPAEGLTTGFEWEYFDRLHVGATGWFIAGERGCNLYWSTCPWYGFGQFLGAAQSA